MIAGISLALATGALLLLWASGLLSSRDRGPAQEGGLRVILDDELSVHPDCSQMDTCTRYYLGYLRKAPDAGEAISEEDLELGLDSISGENQAVAEAEPTAEELREALIDAMNIRKLLDGLKKRPLRFRELSQQALGRVQQVEVLFEDPLVGTFRALLLLPEGPGPFPGIVAHPGHNERADDHRDGRYGRELAGRGFAVLIIDPRANDGDHAEARVAREFLLQGHSMIGLRVYEILLAQKFLRWHPKVSPQRIGLQGHSGGSVAGNLVVRIDEGFAAYVSDLFSTYGIVMDREAGLLGDETSPKIYYWHASMEDLTTSRVPMVQLPYGFEDGPKAMFDFFEEHLD